ncbi:MAG TPA: glycosyltransferase family 39 protein, partial [Gemmatimonadaceae bacterium]
GVAIFGTTPFGVRCVSVLAGLGTVLAVMVLARRLGGNGAALWASLIAACLPFAGAGFVVATPDAPLLLTTALTLVAVDRALEAPARSRDALTWWVISGACLGASFASKYTSVLLPLGVLIAFLISRPLRERLATPGPYVAVAVALVIFAPVLAWNAHHGWISFTFQLHHGLGAPTGHTVQHELELLGGQLALASPVLFVLMAIAVARTLRDAPADETPRGERRYLLAVVAAVMFLFFVGSALDKRVEANWPAIAYVPATVLLALVADRGRWRVWTSAGCVLGAIMVAVIYVHALVPILPFPSGKDPIGQAYGWTSLAASVDTAQSEIQPSAGVNTWVAGDRYQDAAELAFHLPEHPTVFSLNLNSRQNQYALWPGFTRAARPGDNLVVVLTPPEGGEGGRSPVVEALIPHFESVRRGSLVALGRGDDVRSRRRVWMFEGWRGSWPATAISH